MLHWANKDQYYTKSGESFSNYAFTLENGKKVQFRLVDADTAKDNRKDNEQARVFALIEPQIKTETDANGDEIQTDILPFDIKGDLLTLRFEYKAVNKKEKQSDYITQAVEKIQNFAISDDFQEIFTLKPTDTNKTRTLLEKYLTDYTAKNTADYFIHKNLGKFLNQELDFYIKNEVMNLDNIQDSTDFSHIEQNFQTIKTLKTVAKEIIAFLAQLEDFQKKLWLKKKFVVGCHYLITLDHLTEAQVQTALDNPKQTAQWQALFNVNTSGLNVVELCKNYPHLVVDTALFEPTFQADVLREIEHLDDKTNGLLIHSDNFQALNLLQERYRLDEFVRIRSSTLRKEKPKFFYPIYVSPDLKVVTSSNTDGYVPVYPVDRNGTEYSWKVIPETFEENNKLGLYVAQMTEDGIRIFNKFYEQQVFQNVWVDKKYYPEFNGTNLLKGILGNNIFSYPKSIYAVQDYIKITSKKDDCVLDYFAGSGTTAHAVINLNREDNGKRKYILVEQGEYFDTVLKPRVQKVIFSKEWKDGKPQSDNGAFGGVSQIVKVLKLESYEDTLNNLELKQPASDLFAQNEALQNDYLLHYMLDVESRDSLLNTQHFTKPFDYQLNIATTSAGAYEAKTIDLVETFNYLIGLRVSEINDKRENGLVMVQGINTSGEKTLVIWRDCEKYDYDKLNRYLDSRDINPQDSEFEVIYINGDHNVPTVFTDSDDSVKTLKVRSIEAEFLSRMFG